MVESHITIERVYGNAFKIMVTDTVSGTQIFLGTDHLDAPEILKEIIMAHVDRDGMFRGISMTHNQLVWLTYEYSRHVNRQR